MDFTVDSTRASFLSPNSDVRSKEQNIEEFQLGNCTSAIRVSRSTPHWLQLYSRFVEVDRTNSEVKQDQERTESDFSYRQCFKFYCFCGKVFPIQP